MSNQKISSLQFNSNEIPRCIKCNLICSIKLNYIGNYEPRIIYEC